MTIDAITRLRAEAEHYGRGTPDYDYRRRAAWKLAQHHDGIPSCDWTDEPPAWFWADAHEVAA